MKNTFLAKGNDSIYNRWDLFYILLVWFLKRSVKFVIPFYNDNEVKSSKRQYHFGIAFF